MNRGIGQNLETCWFYSSLNVFLLSENGFKIMWKKLKEVYSGLSPSNKNYFNSNVNAPCPSRTSGNIKNLYFWKFLDEYMCSIGGPGRLAVRAGKSRNLLKNIPFRNEGTREAKGLAPGHPQKEIDVILTQLGFTSRDFRMVSWSSGVQADWKTPILIYVSNTNNRRFGIAVSNITLKLRTYDLTGATLTFKLVGASTGHSISFSIVNGHGAVFDSARPSHIVGCKWYDATELAKFINAKYGATENMYFTTVIYTNSNYTREISPYCIRKYKHIMNANRIALSKIPKNSNIGERLARGINANLLSHSKTPRIRAQLVKQYGERRPMTVEAFNFIVNNSNSYNKGVNALKNFKNMGWRYNNTSKNFLNFKRKLLAKHPRPVPKFGYKQVLSATRNIKNKSEAKARLNNFAKTFNYVVNTNAPNYREFMAALDRRFSLRSRSVKKPRK